MYILYGGDFTRAPLVQWVLDEGRIDYELRKVDILSGEHRAPDFLAINPAGLVPVLITPEGDALYEVAALMLYLAERHELTGIAPRTIDPDRGLFLSTVFHIAGDIQPEIKRFHFPHRFSIKPEDNAAVQSMAKSLVFKRLDILNARLTGRGPFVLGSRFSLADFYLSFWVAYLDRRSAFDQFPAIAKVYELTRSRPTATRFLEETERMADRYAEMMNIHPEGVIS